MCKTFPDFVPYDTIFERNYLWHNPFRISKAFLKQKQGVSLDAYGETPFSVLARLAKECHFTPQDRVLELGCGRGKGVFFWSHIANCSVVGIDWVPLFIHRAHRIAEQFKPRLPVEFYCQDMLGMDFSEFSVIYLYGTCLEDGVIQHLISRFENLDESVKIVTVSYPLSDYSPHFYTVKNCEASFPWGTTEIYLNSTTRCFKGSRISPSPISIQPRAFNN